MLRDLDDTSITVGSGNVFADIGVRDPELALAKAQFASRIRQIIGERGWTQSKAAKVMGVDQPKVSAIVRGRLRSFTLDRLLTYLARLNVTVSFTMNTTRGKATVRRGKKKLTA
jgi:predicted XRE-type DNA-binding protein